MSRAGALLAARFSFMPNRLGYCGPEENQAMLDYVVDQHSDRGLEQILGRFAGAFPYYSFIASASGIADVFDERVIEAYWIGNDLLKGIELADFHRHLADRFRPRFSPRVFRSVLGLAPDGARPHHNFHVFSMPVRIGGESTPYTLETMDECRVSWARVVATDGDSLLVERSPLRWTDDEIVLGAPAPRRVYRRFNGKTLLNEATPGDVVAVHWGCACHRLSPEQLRQLVHYTRHHLTLVNRRRHGAVLLQR